jgi:adenosylmethionine-8-amino-7-oxononanoate aminotransferase
MTHLLHRQINATFPTAVGGRGVELFDSTGRAYIDASGGAAVSCLGHGHPDVRAAMHAQLDKLAFAHTAFFTSEPAEALADYIASVAPGNLNHLYLVSGGSEAVESALKMARQYFLEIGQPQRRHIIARRQSYHGNTLGALASGGNYMRRKQFQPLLIETHHIDPCFAYRFQRPGESDSDYGMRAAKALEDEIVKLGPDNVMAFIAETVVGATIGAAPPVGEYFRHIRDICDRYGVLLILDEVMCGMGRTGTLFAFEQEEILPDIVTIAKGLGGGYQPIGAVVLGSHIFEAFKKGSGVFQHGHTYLAHPMAAAAALAVQKVIVRDKLLGNVQRMGRHLDAALRKRLGQHPHVGDIRGRGLFYGIELVADRETKTPFDPALRLHACIKAEAMARGLIVYPAGGTIDGEHGDHVLLAPPFISTAEVIDTIVQRLADAIDAALATIPAAPDVQPA